MKAGWETKTLGHVCERVTVGHVGITSPHYRAGGILFLRTQNVGKSGLVLDDIKYVTSEFHASLKKSEVRAGDVLLSRVITDTVNCAFIPPGFGPANCANVVLVRPAAQLLPEFLIHYIRSSEAQRHLLNRKVGSAQVVVNTNVIKTWPIPVPPLAEQQRIVGILDEAFEGLSTATVNAEKNVRNARALFENHLQSVFTQRGDSPVVPVGDVAEVFDGPHATPKTVDAGPVFLGISALQDGKINLGETRHVTLQDFRQWTRRVRPQTDDVVFSYETRLGQAAIIPEGLECCLGRRMGLVRVNRKRLDPRFFVYQYISPPFRKFLDSKTVRGATVDRIALKEFPSFPIRLPSLAEQERMTSLLDKLKAETQRLESIYQQKLAALGELKKSLLHQAFSGQL